MVIAISIQISTTPKPVRPRDGDGGPDVLNP